MALPDGKPINEEDAMQLLMQDVNSVEVEDDIEVTIVDEDEPVAKVAAESKDEAPDATKDEAPADADSTENDTEYKAFTPAIQKRIQREIRIRRKAEEAANAALEDRRTFETRATERETESENLRASNLELQRNYAEVLMFGFSKDIEIKQRDLKTARDGADFEAEQKIQGELDDLRFKHNQVKEMHSRIPAASEKSASTERTVERPAQQQQPKRVENPIANQWMRSNSSWFNHEKFKTQRRYALVVDAELASEGFDQKTSDYYTELDRRIDEAFPTLRRRKSSDDAPTAGVSESSVGKNSRQITLRRADIDNMRKFGLDPTNKMHLKEFARHMKEQGV